MNEMYQTKQNVYIGLPSERMLQLVLVYRATLWRLTEKKSRPPAARVQNAATAAARALGWLVPGVCAAPCGA